MTVGGAWGRPAALAVALFAVLLTACTPPAAPAPAPPPPTAAPRPSQVVVAVDDLGAGFNPHLLAHQSPVTTALAGLVLPSVFRPDADGGLQLDRTVATSAQVTAQDPFTVTYELNLEASWTSNAPIAAEDFVYLWERMRDEPGVVDAAGYRLITDVRSRAAGKAVDVVFSQRYPAWQTLFANLLPAHLLKDAPGSWTGALANGLPASGGPFRVVSVDRARGEILLTRNDQYWDTPAVLDQLSLRRLGGIALADGLGVGDVDIALPDSRRRRAHRAGRSAAPAADPDRTAARRHRARAAHRRRPARRHPHPAGPRGHRRPRRRARRRCPRRAGGRLLRDRPLPARLRRHRTRAPVPTPDARCSPRPAGPAATTAGGRTGESRCGSSSGPPPSARPTSRSPRTSPRSWTRPVSTPRSSRPPASRCSARRPSRRSHRPTTSAPADCPDDGDRHGDSDPRAPPPRRPATTTTATPTPAPAAGVTVDLMVRPRTVGGDPGTELASDYGCDDPVTPSGPPARPSVPTTCSSALQPLLDELLADPDGSNAGQTRAAVEKLLWSQVPALPLFQPVSLLVSTSGADAGTAVGPGPLATGPLTGAQRWTEPPR